MTEDAERINLVWKTTGENSGVYACEREVAFYLKFVLENFNTVLRLMKLIIFNKVLLHT